MRQSVTHTNKLKVELQNDLTTISKLYPKSHPQTLHLLDKYCKIFFPKTSTSEGSSFAQVDSRPDQKKTKKIKETGEEAEKIKPWIKKYCKDKEWYKCGKKGYWESRGTTVKKEKIEDDKSTKTYIRRSSVKILRRMWRNKQEYSPWSTLSYNNRSRMTMTYPTQKKGINYPIFILTMVMLAKVASNFHSPKRNSNIVLQISPTRLQDITSV